MSRLNDIEKKVIIEMNAKGRTSREISQSLWSTTSRKSTVNDYLVRLRVHETFQALPVEGPKVLIFDIETAPVAGYVWSLWKQNVGLNQIKEDWYVMSWAAKWLGSEEVMYQDCRHHGETDAIILEGIWELLDQADWVITHNGDGFDIPKLRARMIKAGLPPFSPFKSIDTLKEAKKVFKFTSNKLEYIADFLCPDRKKSLHSNFPGFTLWSECLKGNTLAWDEMQAYNIQDVDTLEAVYMKLRPWMQRHPNFALYTETTANQCNVCGGTQLISHGSAYTNLSEFSLYVCGDCGTFKRGRTSHVSKAKRQSLLMNVL